MHGRRRLLPRAPLSAGWICRQCRSGFPAAPRRGFADGKPGGPSIFDQLFPKEKPHKPYSFRPPKASTSKPPYPRTREPEAEPEARPEPLPDEKDGPARFIYEELFPEEKKNTARGGGNQQGREAGQATPGPARARPLGDWGADRRFQRRADDGEAPGRRGSSGPGDGQPPPAGPRVFPAGGGMADDELRKYRSFVLGDPALEGGGGGLSQRGARGQDAGPRDRRTAETAGEQPADPWVVVQLSSASASLLESDFHRLAPQGQHLEGWVSGLKKVLQAHDPATSEPLGQYYLFFETAGAARAYVEEVRRLHALWRRRLFPSSPSSPPRGVPGAPAPLGPLAAGAGAASADDGRAAHAFSLVPPTGDLDLRTLRYGRRLVDEMARRTSLQGVFYRHHLPAARREARVLLALDGPGGGGGGGGGGAPQQRPHPLPPAAVRAAIDEDGRERNLPWRLARGGRRPSVVPVARSADAASAGAKGGRRGAEAEEEEEEEGGGGGADEAQHDEEEEPSSRFLVTFADAEEARRFVRGWHRRLIEEVYDEDKVRSVRVNARVIW